MSQITSRDVIAQDLRNIVRQTWLILDDPSLVARNQFHMILENGAIVSVHTGVDQIAACETVTEPAGWIVPNLPLAPVYLKTDGLGGITSDLDNAKKLRDFTSFTFERVNNGRPSTNQP